MAPWIDPIRCSDARTITLYVCTPRRQLAESIDADPSMTLRDVLVRSDQVRDRLEDEALDVCVGGVPRRMSDRLGNAETIEVYPARIVD